jgi:hypothetical protein
VPLSVFRGQRRPGRKWLRSDTLLAQALELYEDSLCASCGQPRDEAMDPAHDGDNPYRTAEYVVSPPLRDHACTEMSRARKRISDAEYTHPDGLRFGISLVPTAQPTP